MSHVFCVRIAACAAFLPLALSSATPSFAGGGFGLDTAVGVGVAIINQAARAAGSGHASESHSGSSHRHRHDDDDDDGDRKSSDKSSESSSLKTKTAAELAKDARNFAAQQAELEEIQRTAKLESERNVDLAVRNFVSVLEEWHKKLRKNSQANVQASSGSNINQVTDGEVKRAIEDAYREAQLTAFDRLSGQMWTRDRLMVRILKRSEKELQDYFQGVGVKGTSMADLRDVFVRSAKVVHDQALQVAEMIGVSYSFERFIRTIFEQSDRAEEGLWTTGADGRYEHLVTSIVEQVSRENFLSDDYALASDTSGLNRQFMFRFRARRALYDCMAARYSELINNGTQGGTIPVASHSAPAAVTDQRPSRPGGYTPAAVTDGETRLWQRLSEVTSSVCHNPMLNVLGTVKDGNILPMPARWDSNADNAILGNQGTQISPVGLKPNQP